MSETPPAQVLEALETLERPSEPGDLGPAYQVLLEWRGEYRGSTSQAVDALVGIGAGLGAFVSALFFLRWAFPDGISNVWIGVVALLSFMLTSDVIAKRLRARKVGQPLPASIEERIDDALGRWRHLVPAMRELPK